MIAKPTYWHTSHTYYNPFCAAEKEKHCDPEMLNGDWCRQCEKSNTFHYFCCCVSGLHMHFLTSLSSSLTTWMTCKIMRKTSQKLFILSRTSSSPRSLKLWDCTVSSVWTGGDFGSWYWLSLVFSPVKKSKIQAKGKKTKTMMLVSVLHSCRYSTQNHGWFTKQTYQVQTQGRSYFLLEMKMHNNNKHI